MVPSHVDGEFVEEFVSLIKEQTMLGKRFAIITGGGAVARDYRDALVHAGIQDSVILDSMGIAATRMNALLLRYSFGDEYAESDIVLDPTIPFRFSKKVVVAGGWKPGHSSDGAAVGLAQTLGARTVLNLSNIDYVYTADPRHDPDAEPIRDILWTDFLKMIPSAWTPGASAPFDPVAAKMAADNDIDVVVMNGKNLPNLKDYLSGERFMGTIISGTESSDHLPRNMG